MNLTTQQVETPRRGALGKWSETKKGGGSSLSLRENGLPGKARGAGASTAQRRGGSHIAWDTELARVQCCRDQSCHELGMGAPRFQERKPPTSLQGLKELLPPSPQQLHLQGVTAGESNRPQAGDSHPSPSAAWLLSCSYPRSHTGRRQLILYNQSMGDAPTPPQTPTWPDNNRYVGRLAIGLWLQTASSLWNRST